jgi:hypothetical protein
LTSNRLRSITQSGPALHAMDSTLGGSYRLWNWFMCKHSSIARRIRVVNDNTHWIRSIRASFELNGRWRQREAGRLRRLRSCIRTARFNKEPKSARPIIGNRIQLAWSLSKAAPMPALNTTEPIPITKRTPLTARNNVQILCRRAKKKLDQAMTPRVRPSSRGVICRKPRSGCSGLEEEPDIRHQNPHHRRSHWLAVSHYSDVTPGYSMGKFFSEVEIDQMCRQNQPSSDACAKYS